MSKDSKLLIFAVCLLAFAYSRDANGLVLFLALTGIILYVKD